MRVAAFSRAVVVQFVMEPGSVPAPPYNPPRRRDNAFPVVQDTVTLEGHLIDSDALRKAFARIVEDGGEFEVLEFRIGATNADPSFARLAVKARDPQTLDKLLEDLAYLGAATQVADA